MDTGDQLKYALGYCNITCSQDGKYVYMLRANHLSCSLFMSDNYGATWNNQGPVGISGGISTSFDGKIVYISTNRGVIKSEDYGKTFAPLENTIELCEIRYPVL